MKRLRVYKLIAILLPVMVLLLAELCLRMGDFGYDTSLFEEDGDARCLVMNRDISKKYFTIGRNATVGNREAFLRVKPEGTVRFFVLGASSAIGFPYMHNGAFPRMLKYKLQFAFPGHTIEMINLSLTAINSYTLYDFAGQVVDYEPDAILIYAGQNEYYGALGVASSSRIGRNPFVIQSMLAAKELKLVQELGLLIDRLSPRDSALTDPERTLMERMAARQLVPFQSDIYAAGIKQYDRNLGKMLRLFDEHRIPVFIGTLASNLEGQPPLCKENTDAHNAAEEYARGGQACLQGDPGGALRHYTLAKDYDQLRFRAPEEFNRIIHKYGSEYGNVYVADTYKALAEASPHGIIGNELLLEHVHPNLEGHRLMAETFYRALEEHFFPAKGMQPVASGAASGGFPHTAFDSIYGGLAINQLKQQWPFNEAPAELTGYDRVSFEYKTAEAFFYRKINWGEAMQRLNNLYIRGQDYANALRIVEQMCLEVPYDPVFLRQAGSLAYQSGDREKGAWYFKQAEKYD